MQGTNSGAIHNTETAKKIALIYETKVKALLMNAA
jgi:hypothetical protein